MILRDITITNFKNIAQAQLSFSPNINGLLGSNGMGKSNLLDAIYFMSMGKSHTGALDAAVIRSGESFAMVKAIYDRRGQQEELSLGLAEGRGKSLKRQGKRYGRLSEHIGAFPIVLVSPRDSELIHGASDERRRFLDMIISQTDPVYLDHLIRYHDTIKQRNRLLKDGNVDRDLIAAIDMGIAPSATYITSRRQATVTDFSQIFVSHYRDIALTDETPGLTYDSRLAQSGTDPFDLLQQSLSRDTAIGHTTVGPHRDDLTLTIDSMPLRSTASQGQQKTFTVAMRLAQYEFTHRATSLKPLLLLDDIFDRLDASRVANIVDVVSRDIFGQTFITDTNRDHLDSIMRASGADYRLWQVADGQFTLIDHQQ